MKELLSDEFANKLANLAKDKASEYKNNKPFPYIYFDDFLPPLGMEGVCPKGQGTSFFCLENEKSISHAVGK